MLGAEVKSGWKLSGEERGHGGVRLWSQTAWVEIPPLLLPEVMDLRQFTFPLYPPIFPYIAWGY